MKKWWLHNTACICNGVTATCIMLLLCYELFSEISKFDGGGVVMILFFLLGYSIYIISDVWGLNLYSSYKNLDSVSFTNAGKIHVILVFHTLVQAFIGYASFYISLNLIDNFSLSKWRIDGIFTIIQFLILILFITGFIVFIGYILLLVAIKKNMKIIAKEIEEIGK